MGKSSLRLFRKAARASCATPVECTGLSFPDEDARHEHFIELLRQKLADPVLRKTAGFPGGTDEDITVNSSARHHWAFRSAVLHTGRILCG